MFINFDGFRNLWRCHFFRFYWITHNSIFWIWIRHSEPQLFLNNVLVNNWAGWLKVVTHDIHVSNIENLRLNFSDHCHGLTIYSGQSSAKIRLLSALNMRFMPGIFEAKHDSRVLKYVLNNCPGYTRLHCWGGQVRYNRLGLFLDSQNPKK